MVTNLNDLLDDANDRTEPTDDTGATGSGDGAPDTDESDTDEHGSDARSGMTGATDEDVAEAVPETVDDSDDTGMFRFGGEIEDRPPVEHPDGETRVIGSWEGIGGTQMRFAQLPARGDGYRIEIQRLDDDGEWVSISFYRSVNEVTTPEDNQ